MKKIYIFFTWDITTIGGTQLYTAGKANYLQKRGWQVHIFFSGYDRDSSDIPFLTPFLKKSRPMNFLARPPYKYRNYEREFCLNHMLNKLNISDLNDCEIIIESHTDTFAYWAELLASILKARHFFMTTNENYRNWDGTFFEDNLDYFYFKWQRNEIVGRHEAVKNLFKGYKNVTKALYEMPSTIREQDAIQDVAFKIENVARLDWNICHIGRADKSYVPYVIEGVGELARRHPDKRINFIMVGDVELIMTTLQNKLRDCPNIFLTLLGNMVPIPRILFAKVDVVCAMSQSALFAANEDVLTICGSVTYEKRTPGVLGYDTEESVLGKGTFSYVEALENVLVKKLYAGRKSSMPKLRPADECYDDFWTIVKNASPVKDYYIKRFVKDEFRDWTAIFPFGAMTRGARVILFNENRIAKDYRKQIYSQSDAPKEFGLNYVKPLKPDNYFQSVVTVDEHPENFDDSIFGLERLKVRDYDVIVICADKENSVAAYEKIVSVVPDMADRIVWNYLVVFT